MRNERGQTLVEFTLTFMLVLVVAWIPVDFGLGFYTAHLAQNAARDGARIAAADPAANTFVGNCPTLSACYALPTNDPKYQTAVRVNRALMPDTRITMDMPAVTGCNRQITMSVTGTYNFFFYRMLRWFGADIASTGTNITRSTSMRWEHQC